MSDRISKVNALIATRIAEMLTRTLALKPGVFLTVSRVDTSRDLRNAKVFISVFPETESSYALKTLQHEHARIQKTLYADLHMKIVPHISFLYDPTEYNADIVEKIFHDLHT